MTDPVAETASWVLEARNARRLGRVRIASIFLEDYPDYAKQLGEVVKVEHSWTYGYDSAEYTFRGPLFDIVADGEEPPLYDVVTHTVEGKLERMEVKRADGGS